MKKLVFAIVFMLFTILGFSNNSVNSNTLSKNIVLAEDQDCDQYARDAADAEVGFWENVLSDGLLYYASYSYWLGVCETSNMQGAEALAPVFL